MNALFRAQIALCKGILVNVYDVMNYGKIWQMLFGFTSQLSSYIRFYDVMLSQHKYAIKSITSTNSDKLRENQNSLILHNIVCVFKDNVK